MDARCTALEPSGAYLESMHCINNVFETLENENELFSIFDSSQAPFYEADTQKHGIFQDDFVHYTREANEWVAEQIFSAYQSK